MGWTRRGWSWTRTGRSVGTGGGSRGRRALAVIAVLVTTLAVPVGTESAGLGPGAALASVGGASAEPAGVLPADGSWTVTLLTGEVLDVQSDAEGRVTASIREHNGPVRTVRKPDGDLYVIPFSVTPLLDQVLDLELFNVTGLIRQGYDDASTDAVPLIVQRQAGADLQSSLAATGDEQPLPSIGAVATEVPKADARAAGQLLAELSAEVDPASPRNPSAASPGSGWTAG